MEDLVVAAGERLEQKASAAVHVVDRGQTRRPSIPGDRLFADLVLLLLVVETHSGEQVPALGDVEAILEIERHDVAGGADDSRRIEDVDDLRSTEAADRVLVEAETEVALPDLVERLHLDILVVDAALDLVVTTEIAQRCVRLVAGDDEEAGAGGLPDGVVEQA